MKEEITRKIIIVKLNHRVITVTEENGAITELHCADGQAVNEAGIGAVYVGKVKNIVPSIGAAFIEIAPGVECYYDLRKNKMPVFTAKIGKKPLCIGDELLVQVEKEAVKTKVMTVTGNFNLTGKYAVLVHGEPGIGVSSKISKRKREAIKERLECFKTEGYGFIIRTNAQEADAVLLDEEMKRLTNEYQSLLDVADKRTVFSCLKSAKKPYMEQLRNIRQEGLLSIMIEDDEIYNEVKAFLRTEQPEDIQKLTHYTDKLLPLHKLYGIESLVESILKERVWLKSGAYLVIQYTEAMTVIDVNTGKAVKKKKSDGFFMKINKEAAREAARQMRLRNLSGIIMIDFINLEDTKDSEELMDFIREELKKDTVPATLVDMTGLHLIEITRKKVRKPFHESYWSLETR